MMLQERTRPYVRMSLLLHMLLHISVYTCNRLITSVDPSYARLDCPQSLPARPWQSSELSHIPHSSSNIQHKDLHYIPLDRSQDEMIELVATEKTMLVVRITPVAEIDYESLDITLVSTVWWGSDVKMWRGTMNRGNDLCSSCVYDTWHCWCPCPPRSIDWPIALTLSWAILTL